MLKFTLYSKAECSLCDKARLALEAFRRECEFELQIVDIEPDAELKRKYQYDIPVLLLDGAEAVRHFIDIAKLRVLARRAKSDVPAKDS